MLLWVERARKRAFHLARTSSTCRFLPAPCRTHRGRSSTGRVERFLDYSETTERLVFSKSLILLEHWKGIRTSDPRFVLMVTLNIGISSLGRSGPPDLNLSCEVLRLQGRKIQTSPSLQQILSSKKH